MFINCINFILFRSEDFMIPTQSCYVFLFIPQIFTYVKTMMVLWVLYGHSESILLKFVRHSYVSIRYFYYLVILIFRTPQIYVSFIPYSRMRISIPFIPDSHMKISIYFIPNSHIEIYVSISLLFWCFTLPRYLYPL